MFGGFWAEKRGNRGKAKLEGGQRKSGGGVAGRAVEASEADGALALVADEDARWVGAERSNGIGALTWRVRLPYHIDSALASAI